MNFFFFFLVVTISNLVTYKVIISFDKKEVKMYHFPCRESNNMHGAELRKQK